jgi:cyclophilin family peptidyl-prolyl cis-trans isomerase
MFKKILLTILLPVLLTSTAFAEGDNPKVTLQTNLGNITLELFPNEAPETVANFLKYVDSGYYEGTIFHRVIAGFMIQGGGFTADMKKKDTLEAIKNESQNGLSNTEGTIAMARTNYPHSATSQFFINTVNNRNLDARGNRFGYAVFGRVTDGMELAVEISRVPRAEKGGHRDVPKSPIIIEKVVRVSE